jgi:hypothetical protein
MTDLDKIIAIAEQYRENPYKSLVYTRLRNEIQ